MARPLLDAVLEIKEHSETDTMPPSRNAPPTSDTAEWGIIGDTGVGVCDLSVTTRQSKAKTKLVVLAELCIMNKGGEWKTRLK